MFESKNDFFIDIACKQQNYKLETVCGDTFMCKRTNKGKKTILVLSDGMGHGVKANVLSSLTASLAIHHNFDNNNLTSLAHTIVKTLPVCSKRKINYCTFSIVKINQMTDKAMITEYDNPQCLIYRNGKILQTIDESNVIVNNPNRHQVIRTTAFSICEGDRIIIMSDGVVQSGQGKGKGKYTFGWGRNNVDLFIREKIAQNSQLTSDELANLIVGQAVENDNQITNDDISCAVVTIRKPRKVILASVQPPDKQATQELIDRLYNFEGTRIICGYHLAKLIANQKDIEVEKFNLSEDPDVPPMWKMDGIDLLTEGLVTLNKVSDVLHNVVPYNTDKGSVHMIVRSLLESDEIHMVIGTKIQNDEDYFRFDEYKMRRNVLRHIAKILETKYMKSVKTHYH